MSISARSSIGQSLGSSSSTYEEYESVRESWMATKAISKRVGSFLPTSLKKFLVSMSNTILRIMAIRAFQENLGEQYLPYQIPPQGLAQRQTFQEDYRIVLRQLERARFLCLYQRFQKLHRRSKFVLWLKYSQRRGLAPFL